MNLFLLKLAGYSGKRLFRRQANLLLWIGLILNFAARASNDSSLKTWFAADSIAGLTNGEAVSKWHDMSGCGDDAVQTNAGQSPVYVTEAINGLPAVRFNAANKDFLALDRPVQDDFTIFCVFRSTGGYGNGSLFYQGAGLVSGEVPSATDFGSCLFANGQICAGTGGPDVAVNSVLGFNDGRPHLMTFKRTKNVGHLALYVDGVFMGSTVGNTASLQTPARLTLGAQQTLTRFLTGEIAEVKIYDSALADDVRVNQENQLIRKWGIPKLSARSLTGQPKIYIEEPSQRVTQGLGSWIWDKVTTSKQTVRLWKTFQIPKDESVKRAELRISADNAYTVWIDGKKIGSGSDWHTLNVYDFNELKGRLNPGVHTLAVEGFNDWDKAGIIVGWLVEMADGRVLQIKSDSSWRVVPSTEIDWQTATQPSTNWPNAAAIASVGQSPWWTPLPVCALHIPETFPAPDSFWQSSEFRLILLATSGIFIATCLYLLIQLLSQSKAHRLLQDERDRIARDIHDDLGSKLTELLLTGEMAQIKTMPDLSKSFSQICAGTRDILNTIDEVVWIVDSQHDTLEDFADYVCKFTEQFLKSTAIRHRFDVALRAPPKRLDSVVRRNLLLAVKEALNNAAKHSQATELTLRMELNASELTIVVADNGQGFRVEHANDARNGLINMKLRMKEIGGHCHITSRLGEGCQVQFQMPLKRYSFFKSIFKAKLPEQDIDASLTSVIDPPDELGAKELERL